MLSSARLCPLPEPPAACTDPHRGCQVPRAEGRLQRPPVSLVMPCFCASPRSAQYTPSVFSPGLVSRLPLPDRRGAEGEADSRRPAQSSLCSAGAFSRSSAKSKGSDNPRGCRAGRRPSSDAPRALHKQSLGCPCSPATPPSVGAIHLPFNCQHFAAAAPLLRRARSLARRKRF